MSHQIKQISEQFLSGLCVKKIDLANVIDDLVDPCLGVIHQDTLLSLTINNPLVIKYPLKVEYQQSFMRKLITELESRGADIHSKVYESLIKILQSKNGESVFRHFTVNKSPTITIKESASIISNGTTGLCVWEAAHVLINWCFKNKDILEKSTVLELGSGVGLCGIAVSFLCKPIQYVFSDCHPFVMNSLMENVKINQAYDSESSVPLLLPNERVTWSGKLLETNITIAHLPWEDIVEEQLASVISPNFVIASDVVYDPCLFESLSKTMSEFVCAGSQVILACTERNSDTLKKFMEELSQFGLKASEEYLPDTGVMAVSTDYTVRIYRITRLKK